MKNRSLLFLLALLHLSVTLQSQYNRDISIDSLLKMMNTEEKVGQMSQVDLGVVAVGDICNLKNPQALDIDKLKLAIAKYKVGSILNVGCGSGTIAMDNWRQIIDAIQNTNNQFSRLKIPVLYGIDAIHGANYTMGATLFPQEIGQAATWNPQLVEQANAISAYETRASAIPWNFSPVLDLGRQPLWSRFFETYGEDVFLAKTMAKSAVNGLQGSNTDNPYKVSACMKHFLGYSFPLSGKDRTPAWISDRELREYFVPTFQQAINAGAKTVMINSGDINGTPVHANYDILTGLLRHELGFTGVAVTDWEDIYKLVSVHHVATDKKEAVKMAIMAGIDMSMTPNDFQFNELLLELVNEGGVPLSRIDEAVTRILKLKKDLGLFNQPFYPLSMYPKFGSLEFSDVSYKAACESVTLLKNKDGLLPLENKEEKIFVCGPAANSLNLLNGAWTHTWQGVDATYNTKNKKTILESLISNYSKKGVSYSLGASLDSLGDMNVIISEAKSSDKIIICLGEKPCTEIPGNIDELELSDAQKQLVLALATLKKPIILVCCFNRPRIIHDIVEKVDAILYGYLPGDEGGRAIADCIVGKVNPSGRLPFTYPMASNAIVHYDHKASEDQDIDFSQNAYRPEFDFGFGLSYTQFQYSSFKFSDTILNNTDSIVLNFSITNSGSKNGMEVAQLYYKDMVASITPSVKKLTNFQKIALNPGETKELRFIMHKEDFSFIDKNLKRITEPGAIEIQLSNQKKVIYVR